MRTQCETITLQPVGNLNKVRGRNYLTINSALCSPRSKLRFCNQVNCTVSQAT